MITHDGALWQKVRMPQQPAFHPDAFVDYIPYFIEAIKSKMDQWAKLAKTRRDASRWSSRRGRLPPT